MFAVATQLEALVERVATLFDQLVATGQGIPALHQLIVDLLDLGQFLAGLVVQILSGQTAHVPLAVLQANDNAVRGEVGGEQDGRGQTEILQSNLPAKTGA